MSAGKLGSGLSILIAFLFFSMGFLIYQSNKKINEQYQNTPAIIPNSKALKATAQSTRSPVVHEQEQTILQKEEQLDEAELQMREVEAQVNALLKEHPELRPQINEIMQEKMKDYPAYLKSLGLD